MEDLRRVELVEAKLHSKNGLSRMRLPDSLCLFPPSSFFPLPFTVRRPFRERIVGPVLSEFGGEEMG
jgi:hypothetical protein